MHSHICMGCKRKWSHRAGECRDILQVWCKCNRIVSKPARTLYLTLKKAASTALR